MCNLHLYKVDFRGKKNQYLYPHAHSSITDNSQKVEATQMSTGE